MPLLTRPSIDWKNPDYDAIFTQRLQLLDRIRSDARPDIIVTDMMAVYREYPAQMICDWGVTVDPRNLERNLPTVVPFIPFDRQVEWFDWVIKCWRDPKARINLTEKSRDMGISWCAVALADVLCILFDGMQIGVGSRKAELVDDLGNPKALLPKARTFLRYLPREFRGGWIEAKHSKEMLLEWPNGSAIGGEAGDDIGRGDRKAIYLVDEAAHLEHPESIDASLSNTTNCRIEMSSVKGMDNPFAQRRFSGKHEVFTFHWKSDPRKDDAWYASMQDELDPVVLAQEVDINYSASVEGVVIPSLWVQAAIDAHVKLGISISGIRHGSLDVAGGGVDGRSVDKNAFGSRYGILVDSIQQWSGTDAGDTFGTVARAFNLCDEMGLTLFDYDADGLGALVRGDGRVLNEQRKAENAIRKDPATHMKIIRTRAFRGSASGDALYQPMAKVKGPDGKSLDRTNKDYFANYKAQSWWALRYRFQQTYRAVVKGMKVDPDEIISLSATLDARLIVELSQPVYSINGAGKMVIDKAPEGMASPNEADVVMMLFAPRRNGLHISDEAIDRF